MISATLWKAIATTNWYLSLHSGDPGRDGAYELMSPEYTRMPIHIDIAHHTIFGPVQFPNPDAHITHVGFWTAKFGPKFWGGFLLREPVDVPAGVPLEIPAGGVRLIL